MFKLFFGLSLVSTSLSFLYAGKNKNIDWWASTFDELSRPECERISPIFKNSLDVRLKTKDSDIRCVHRVKRYDFAMVYSLKKIPYWDGAVAKSFHPRFLVESLKTLNIPLGGIDDSIDGDVQVGVKEMPFEVVSYEFGGKVEYKSLKACQNNLENQVEDQYDLFIELGSSSGVFTEIFAAECFKRQSDSIYSQAIGYFYSL